MSHNIKHKHQLSPKVLANGHETSSNVKNSLEVPKIRNGIPRIKNGIHGSGMVYTKDQEWYTQKIRNGIHGSGMVYTYYGTLTMANAVRPL